MYAPSIYNSKPIFYNHDVIFLLQEKKIKIQRWQQFLEYNLRDTIVFRVKRMTPSIHITNRRLQSSSYLFKRCPLIAEIFFPSKSCIFSHSGFQWKLHHLSLKSRIFSEVYILKKIVQDSEFFVKDIGFQICFKLSLILLCASYLSPTPLQIIFKVLLFLCNSLII